MKNEGFIYQCCICGEVWVHYYNNGKERRFIEPKTDMFIDIYKYVIENIVQGDLKPLIPILLDSALSNMYLCKDIRLAAWLIDKYSELQQPFIVQSAYGVQGQRLSVIRDKVVLQHKVVKQNATLLSTLLASIALISKDLAKTNTEIPLRLKELFKELEFYRLLKQVAPRLTGACYL